MSVRVESIDWKRLSHAYGPATNVPGLLRQLRDPSEEVREEAMMDLCNCINHQGSIYEATVPAVPCLFELAEDPSMPDRAAVLGILGGISEGWNTRVRNQPTNPADWEIRWRGTAERMIYERPYREAAHRAVEERLNLLTLCLRDADRKVRVGAAFVLATFLDRRVEAAKALLEWIDIEPDDWCRAGAVFALTSLAIENAADDLRNSTIRRLRSLQAAPETGPDCRLCAGVALLRLGETAGLAETLALARPRLARDHRYFYPFPSATWSRSLFGLVCDSLHSLDEPRVDWIREGLQHAHPEVISSAFSEMSRLRREVRWGPARFLPDVLPMVDSADEKVRLHAVSALSDMGHEGYAQLEPLTRHPRDDVRSRAVRSLEGKRLDAARREWHFQNEPPAQLRAIDTLVGVIADHEASPHWDNKQIVREALRELGFHGTAAANALDSIRGQTANVTPEVRLEAIRTLWKATGDASVVVPLLLNDLRPEPRYVLLVMQQLREMGPAARDALPALKTIAESPQRFSNGAFSTSCSDDDAFREAAIIAIAAIEERQMAAEISKIVPKDID